MTSQRRLILETLEAESSHPTAEDLFRALKPSLPALNLSTVYRTLRWLEQEGLISSRWFREGRYQERFDPTLKTDHYHFLCTNCQRVIEFGNPEADRIIEQFERSYGARVESSAIVLYGLCASCSH